MYVGLQKTALRKIGSEMNKSLTLLPTIVEVAAIAVLAYLTLSMPWLWGIALG